MSFAGPLPPRGPRTLFHEAHVKLYLKLFVTRHQPRPRVLQPKHVEYLVRLGHEL